MALSEVSYDIGGDLTPTLLWENPNKSSTITSPPLDATLSNSIENYLYIKIVYKGMASDNDNTAISEIISVEDFKKSTSNARFTMGAVNNDVGYVRQFRYLSSTSVRFGAAYNYGSGSTVTSYCIPLYIYGLK